MNSRLFHQFNVNETRSTYNWFMKMFAISNGNPIWTENILFMYQCFFLVIVVVVNNQSINQWICQWMNEWMIPQFKFNLQNEQICIPSIQWWWVLIKCLWNFIQVLLYVFFLHNNNEIPNSKSLKWEEKRREWEEEKEEDILKGTTAILLIEFLFYSRSILFPSSKFP